MELTTIILVLCCVIVLLLLMLHEKQTECKEYEQKNYDLHTEIINYRHNTKQDKPFEIILKIKNEVQNDN